MDKDRKKILFVSHNASRTGAPHVLLGIIREFREEGVWDIQILTMENGPLVADFKSLGKTFVWYHEPRHLITGRKGLTSFLTKAYYKLRGIVLLRKIMQADVIFLNTMTNGQIHKKLVSKSKLFFTYVHELGSSIHANSNTETLRQALEGTSFFFTASGAVARMLSETFSVDETKMMVLYASLSKSDLNKEKYRIETEAFRHRNRIPGEAFVVGILGTGEWRKGFDWFFTVVKMYFKKFPEGKGYFIWKGVGTSDRENYYNRFDFEKGGMSDRVILLPHGNDALAVMANFDVHLLLAREDPFPLVVLEAASFGIPTICFKDAGGIPEFVGEDAGICIEYGDLDAMAEAIIKLEKESGLLRLLGSTAKAKVADYQAGRAAQTIMAVTKQFIK